MQTENLPGCGKETPSSNPQQYLLQKPILVNSVDFFDDAFPIPKHKTHPLLPIISLLFIANEITSFKWFYTVLNLKLLSLYSFMEASQTFSFFLPAIFHPSISRLDHPQSTPPTIHLIILCSSYCSSSRIFPFPSTLVFSPFTFLSHSSIDSQHHSSSGCIFLFDFFSHRHTLARRLLL